MKLTIRIYGIDKDPAYQMSNNDGKYGLDAYSYERALSSLSLWESFWDWREEGESLWKNLE